MKIDKVLETVFLIIGILTVLEFVFIQGLFTWLIMVVLVCIAGLLNVIMCLRNSDFSKAALYVLCSVALCMGYFVML